MCCGWRACAHTDGFVDIVLCGWRALCIRQLGGRLFVGWPGSPVCGFLATRDQLPMFLVQPKSGVRFPSPSLPRDTPPCPSLLSQAM